MPAIWSTLFAAWLTPENCCSSSALICVPVMSIETRKLLNGCTVNALPKVTAPPFEARSARIPPGFMNATTGVLPLVTVDGSASCASAIRLPSGDSCESSGVFAPPTGW